MAKMKGLAKTIGSIVVAGGLNFIVGCTPETDPFSRTPEARLIIPTKNGGAVIVDTGNSKQQTNNYNPSSEVDQSDRTIVTYPDGSQKVVYGLNKNPAVQEIIRQVKVSRKEIVDREFGMIRMAACKYLEDQNGNGTIDNLNEFIGTGYNFRRDEDICIAVVCNNGFKDINVTFIDSEGKVFHRGGSEPGAVGERCLINVRANTFNYGVYRAYIFHEDREINNLEFKIVDKF